MCSMFFFQVSAFGQGFYEAVFHINCVLCGQTSPVCSYRPFYLKQPKMVFFPLVLNLALMCRRPKWLELWRPIYCLHVCPHGGAGVESIWVCTQVSICALFVCHSPLKLQLPSRHDFPLCRNQQTRQHLTSTTHQLSLRLTKTSITLPMTCGHCFPIGTSHILPHLMYRCPKMESVSELPHLPLWLPLMKTPHLRSSTSVHFCLSSIPLFFPLCLPCLYLSERETESAEHC